ncbi:ATPase [Lewinellaceae bacterium SD302]|nr:ATPase [Lewinellaceae bacterium SD302]
MILEREQLKNVFKFLRENKAIVLLGPRRVGKTVMLKQLIQQLDEPYLLLNGEAADVQELLARRTVENYRNLLGKKRILIIDEAQKIDEIGWVLKLMIDEIPGLKIIATGSSAFDVENKTGEPLTGRKYTFNIHPLSERELTQTEDLFTAGERLKQRLVYGNYPELISMTDNDERQYYLQELINTYLLKDILTFEGIKNNDRILALLRLIAFQVGSEVSYSEIGRQLSLDKVTVERYLNLLSKVFVIHRVGAFSRNLRKEIVKGKRWYFYDNGVRNALLNNFNPLALRQDIGTLWENYAISERLKYQASQRLLSYNYFWRTYDQQEIDWIEDRGGRLHTYEFKWNAKKIPKQPIAFRRAYPDSDFAVINPENLFDWVEKW